MAKKRVKLSDQVRRAVEASGLSQAQIARALGSHKATMSRFMRGERGLTLDVLDALANLLNLNLEPPEKVERRKREKR